MRAIRHTTRLRDRDRDRVENLVSHSDMDRYNDRVPIRTVSSGTRYDGRVWYELLSSIQSVNGTSVSEVAKSMLKHGDRVTLEYKKRTYEGVVDVETVTDPVITEIPLGAWQDNTRSTTDERHQLGTSTPKCTPQQAGTPRKIPNRPVQDTPTPQQAETPRKIPNRPVQDTLTLLQAGTPRKRPNRPVQDALEPQQAGTSPRKGKNRVGQDTPPKKRKLAQEKRMVLKKAGTC